MRLHITTYVSTFWVSAEDREEMNEDVLLLLPVAITQCIRHNSQSPLKRVADGPEKHIGEQSRTGDLSFSVSYSPKNMKRSLALRTSSKRSTK